jgi:hypothetical protein
MFHLLSHAGVITIFGLAVTILPMMMGAVYAIRPTEANLGLMRPLSLAGLFAGLTTFCAGLINVLIGIANTANPIPTRGPSLGLSEAILPLFVSFGCLTVAWLLVAVGLRRQP